MTGNDAAQQACPICTSKDTAVFFSQKDVPVQCGFLAPTRQQALAAPLDDITLRYCSACSHVWNASFDPDLVGFDPNYDFSQYHSAAYRNYVEGAVKRLVTRYGLKGKTALDIACGKGDFMRYLIAGGLGRAIGFDPTYVDGSLSEEELRRITVHKRFYDQSQRDLRVDLVTCRSALQYIPDARGFLQSVRDTLDQQLNTVLCFEVPNGQEPFRERVVWYVMYEAGCFFTASSLARLFTECGFEVLDVIPALGGSHLEIEARPAVEPIERKSDPSELKRMEADVAAFAAEYERQASYWTARFHRLRQEGKRVSLWGAGMRAISLLVGVPDASAGVDFVVDVNPHRQGRFLPKTGHEVVAPERLLQSRPDLVIATNPNYAEEIRGQLQSLGLNCEFEVLS